MCCGVSKPENLRGRIFRHTVVPQMAHDVLCIRLENDVSAQLLCELGDDLVGVTVHAGFSPATVVRYITRR